MLNIGQEVEVVVDVSNGNGIGVYELDIAYDNNVLEFVKGESIIQT